MPEFASSAKTLEIFDRQGHPEIAQKTKKTPQTTIDINRAVPPNHGLELTKAMRISLEITFRTKPKNDEKH